MTYPDVIQREGNEYRVGRQGQTYFFKMGITGFKMASNMFNKMEFPVKTH